MKKSVLVIALMMMSTTFISAQEFIYFGVKGGVNFSTINGDFEGSPESRTGYHLGLLAEVPLSDRFSIQPEVLYSAQGFDVVEREDAENLEYKLDYINVPVLAKVYLIQGLSIEAGPQIGFLVNEEIGDANLDEDQFKSIDFSLGMGASYKFNKFFVSGRYNLGVSDIYDNGAGDAKHSVFQAGVGVMF